MPRLACRVFLFAAALPVLAYGEGLAWPASKAALVALTGPLDPTLADTLRAESNAAFDNRAVVDAVALRRLESLVRFMAAHPVSEDVRAWFFAHRAVAEEFVDTLSPEDDAAAVARILGDIRKADPSGFDKYPALACAVALVYDKPCPSWFPHAQVPGTVLPRKLHDPVEVFSFFRESADAGRLIQSPAKLGIDELAFVVPVLAPFPELREVQRRKMARPEIPKLYPSIAYDMPRFKNRELTWPHASYSLATIRAKGGICVDQAYYTATTAQAFGVPAFILSGGGNGGFHAFVGYLERAGHWRTDVGRYANQKYTTGTALNPLTWGELTDHDLAFLESRFRGTPAYAGVLLGAVRATEAMVAGDLATAAKLLSAAKTTEPRCPEVWEALGALAERRGDPPAQVQALDAEAAKALARFRELEVRWRTRLADSLESAGKAETALAERLAIVRRNAGARPDLAMALAETLMDEALKSTDPKRAIAVFNKLAGQFEEAGPEFLTRVAYPVVAGLLKAGRKKEAAQVVKSVAAKFKGDPDSQLTEMQGDLAACVEAGSMRASKLTWARE